MIIARPAIAPITIPVIAPPERLFPELPVGDGTALLTALLLDVLAYLLLVALAALAALSFAFDKSSKIEDHVAETSESVF